MAAAVAEMVPPQRRASAYGLFTAVYGVSWFLGSALIGILYDTSLVAVMRTVGGEPELVVDAYPRQRLLNGDTVVLCTDGLWGMVPSEQIRDLACERPAQAAADALVAAANQAGGRDNITVIVCQIGAPMDGPEAESTELLGNVLRR